ncbi:MAG: hypothetical protein ACK4NR_11245 [Micavibrio sp.]
MFPKGEVKRSLLGTLEFALLMWQGRSRFGTSQEEAIRSFIVPILFSVPLLFVVLAYPTSEASEMSRNSIALMYALRIAVVTGIFLAAVWWIVNQIDRQEYFMQFVTANNWLSVPATIIIVPCLWLVFNGTHTWEEVYPFMCVLMIYSYLFTAFMASAILRIPLELAGFITFISYAINTHAGDFMVWVGQNLLS